MEKVPFEIYSRRRKILTIAAQKTFLKEGDAIAEIYTLYSGWAFQFKQIPDGRRQILSFLIPGDAITLESLCFPDLTLPFSVKSITGLFVCTFGIRDMIELTHRPGDQFMRLSGEMRDSVARMNCRLVDLGRRSALGRVAQLLLELESRLRARHLSQNGTFHFPVRQEDMADALGLTPVYVNRTMDRLRQHNIISFDRQRMKILDIPALTSVAEEE